MAPFFPILQVLSLLSLLLSAIAQDILQLRSSIAVEEYETNILQSQDGTFSCGFYRIYKGAFTFSIWYTHSADGTVVWTANRGRPVHARGSTVTLRKGGTLVLTDYGGTVVWQAGGNSVDVRYVQLLNSGNLVMMNSSGKVWQSFDSPTDTLLPTQLITADTKLVSSTGERLYVPGHYFLHYSDTSILSLIYDNTNVHEIYWPNPDLGEYENKRNRYNSTRMGFLDDSGKFFSSDFANQQEHVASDEGAGIKRRLTLDHDGNLRIYSLNTSDGRWLVSWVAVSQPCDIHGFCGPNGICHHYPAPKCSCPPGYEMNNPRNWTQGCRAVVDVTCGVDQAQAVKFVPLPGTDFWGSDQRLVEKVSLHTCKDKCLKDCTCRGFQYQQGSGSCYPKAFLYNGKAYTPATKSTHIMYLKLPESVNISGISIPQTNLLVSGNQGLNCSEMGPETTVTFLDAHNASRDAKWSYFYGFAGAIFVLEVLFVAFVWFFVLRRELGASEIQAVEKGYKAMTSNFRRYSYKELVKATRKFKHELGRGGSGIVYKGILDDSRVVAVKVLENVRQCEEEFQAELRIIGRINHMNLVRIWGFCSETCYRMLVTEYIENGSLANILFSDNALLEWGQRFVIALGVAKGLAYLHHECLEWVIHCDVKPENILLDSNLEPKIADFGLAKLLNRGGSNQNVSRVRGTIGYIAPEWISSLQITSKVDVYSYGVVLLELVLGKRVLDLAIDADEEVHKVLRELVRMLEHMLHKEEQSSIHEVVDCRLNGRFDDIQVRTLIELAVSCLDEDRNKRPTMESIVQKLILAESCSI